MTRLPYNMSIRRYTIVVLGFLPLLFTMPIQAQSTDFSLMDIVEEMALDNIVCSSGVGRASTVSLQWKRFRQLEQTATDEQLVELTTTANAVVRCYAFLALVNRRHPQVYHILLRHKDDKEGVELFVGCINSFSTVRECFLRIATQGFLSTKKQRSILTYRQAEYVRSLFSRSAEE